MEINKQLIIIKTKNYFGIYKLVKILHYLTRLYYRFQKLIFYIFDNLFFKYSKNKALLTHLLLCVPQLVLYIFNSAWQISYKD